MACRYSNVKPFQWLDLDHLHEMDFPGAANVPVDTGNWFLSPEIGCETTRGREYQLMLCTDK